MKKKFIGIVLLLSFSALIVWGYNQYSKPTNNILELSGTIEATEVNLSSKLPGTLEFVAVNPGDQIKTGQLIAGIIRNDLSAQNEASALSVSQAQARLNDLASGARQQEFTDAQAAVNIAQTSHDKAAADYDRINALHQHNSVADSDLEKAKTNLEISKNQLDSAKAKLSLLQSGARPEQISAAMLEVEKSKANLKASNAVLDDTKIMTFIEGTVISRNFEPGEYIPVAAPVVTVADLNNLWIRVFVATDDLPKIHLGQKVTFGVSGVSEQFPGTIQEISSKGEFTPKTIQTKQERTNIVFAVKIKIDNPKDMFKPGMPADVFIELN